MSYLCHRTIILRTMEIRQLKYFINVAETHSFSEASRQCYLSQSAISQQIKLLEEELGCQLFLRNTHSVMLTESGEELLPLARKALKSFDTCQEHMLGIRGLITGQLNIGMTEAMEPYIRHAVMEMLKRYPQLHINMFYQPSQELRRMLIAHELDLAFTINTPEEGDGIESEPITSYGIYAIMSKTHPLANKEHLSTQDLRAQNIILPERNGGAMRALGQKIQAELELMNIRSYSDSANAILNIVQESHFISFLSHRTIYGRSGLVAKEVKELPSQVYCYAHKLKEVCQKQSSKVFLEILTKESIPYYNKIEELMNEHK